MTTHTTIEKEIEETPLLAYVNGNAIWLKISDNREYDILLTRINTSGKLCGWMIHLLAKHWFTKEHASQLLEICESIGVKIDIHS